MIDAEAMIIDASGRGWGCDGWCLKQVTSAKHSFSACPCRVPYAAPTCESKCSAICCLHFYKSTQCHLVPSATPTCESGLAGKASAKFLCPVCPEWQNDFFFIFHLCPMCLQ
eukprot:scaffold84418_cov17-Tisochrysis_lutea.AAC.1